MPNRRTLIAQTMLFAGLALSSNVWSQAMTMRISHAAAETDWLNKSMLMFKEKVEAALPGQVAVQVHGASSLFRQGTEVPALQRGNLEMSTMTTFEVEQHCPSTAS
jgi:TRAP-type C4-dicarboxylate transport system substrate-binding protein